MTQNKEGRKGKGKKLCENEVFNNEIDKKKVYIILILKV